MFLLTSHAAALPPPRVQPRSRVPVALGIVAALLFVSSWARADTERCVAAHERAQVERLEGHYLAARSELLICAQRECPRLVSSDCTNWLGEVDLALPTVVFAVSDASGRDLLDARVFLNGELIVDHTLGHALPIDPGLHKVRFEADGYAPTELSLSVRDGEKSRLVRGTLSPSVVPSELPSVVLPAAPPIVAATAAAAQSDPLDEPTNRRLLLTSYVLGAASVASLTVALASGLRGYQLEQDCADGGCSPATRERGARLYRTFDGAIVVGGVLLTTATVTLLSALYRARRKEPTHELSAFGGVHGAGLQTRWRW